MPAEIFVPGVQEPSTASKESVVHVSKVHDAMHEKAQATAPPGALALTPEQPQQGRSRRRLGISELPSY